MKYEKEPMRILTPAPNGTYEVTVMVTAHEAITFTIYSQSRRVMARDVKMKDGSRAWKFTYCATEICRLCRR